MKLKLMLIPVIISSFLSSCHFTSSISTSLVDDTSSTSVVTSSASSLDSLHPTIRFNVNIPLAIATTANIRIAGSFNSWNPLAEHNILTKLDTYNYQIDLVFLDTDVAMTIEYKYVLLLPDQLDNPWTNVEGTSTGGERSNRTYIIKEGFQTVNDTVAAFKNNITQSSVTRGTLQKVVLTMSQYSEPRQRTIRIWLPDGYDGDDTSKKYPVMYLHDGQNLFDTYTSFAGEWKIDETIGKMMDDGYFGAIIVGIDNSADRLNELSPTWTRTSSGSTYIANPSGELYAAFIVETVKPYIDSHFNTNPSRATTGIGGSSMGGVISLYMALTYPEVFGYGLLFSTAMWLYEQNTISNFVSSKSFIDINELPRLYLYAGGLETSVTPYVASISNALINHGYPSEKIATHVDPSRDHNEVAWAYYFPIAYQWLILQ